MSNLSAEQLIANPKEHQILHFGYLTKQGSVVASWRRRFFILYPNQLVYYKTIKDKQVQGCLEIGKQHCSRVSRADDECKKKYALQLDFFHRKPFFAFADQEVDIDTWLIKITEAIGKVFVVKPLHYFLNKQDKLNEFEFESIAEALEKAQGGETIQIYPGIYFEDFLTITKPIQCIGASPTEELLLPFEYKHEPMIQELLQTYQLNPHTQVIILSHKGNSCFILKSNSILLKQLHIVCHGNGENCHCIEMDNGQAVLQDCECINIAQGSGLFIMNTSQLQLQQVSIHHCTHCGIVCMDRSVVQLSNCQLFHNQWTGLYCCGESQCHLQQNSITENGIHGLAATDKSQVMLQQNQIMNNLASGVRVCLESTICGQENQIIQNRECNISKEEDNEQVVVQLQ